MPKQSAALSRTFAALADPTRRRIVERLSQSPASVSELARPLAMSLPAVVQHLHVLEESGLVKSEKIGRVRTCRIDPKAIGVAQTWLSKQADFWNARFDRMDALLESKELKDE
jgi:DNA-binding transcriptional ArsR family regulator